MSGSSSSSASRSAKSIITTSVFGSADLWDAMQANILPRTLSAGWPHVVVTSTSGSVRPMDSTVLKLTLRATAGANRNARSALARQVGRHASSTVELRTTQADKTNPCDAISRYAGRVRPLLTLLALVGGLAPYGCDGGETTPSGPTGANTVAVHIVFLGATARRTDLPSSAQACVSGVGVTHTHPSWRDFATIALQPVPPDRYEITFADVPVNARVSFRINDQNACDENPTGAVTRNVFANDVRLVQNTTTPGNGDEPGFAFMVAANGTITQ